MSRYLCVDLQGFVPLVSTNPKVNWEMEFQWLKGDTWDGNTECNNGIKITSSNGNVSVNTLSNPMALTLLKSEFCNTLSHVLRDNDDWMEEYSDLNIVNIESAKKLEGHSYHVVSYDNLCTLVSEMKDYLDKLLLYSNSDVGTVFVGMSEEDIENGSDDPFILKFKCNKSELIDMHRELSYLLNATKYWVDNEFSIVLGDRYYSPELFYNFLSFVFYIW